MKSRTESGLRRRGFSLLVVMFVLTLVGVTLLTLGSHFSQTTHYAQSARVEAQAAQILHSGLAWAKLHRSELSVTGNDAPILLDASSLTGPADRITLSWGRDGGKNGWQLTVRLERGRHRLTRSVFFHQPSPES